ncbi:integrin alpha-M-like [Seriola lalandi dorsalis]|uniref:integrin alpha-M-like n=1 Tax=Seriola lalandi dorsalis TaxID=1841481 RepID=UPI000C6FB5A8|nr:integrin alpha-M-like [Seriola lalandi dorsalis]
MQGQRHLFLLTYMVAFAIHVSLAFNIDTTNTDVYTGKQEDFFGYKVLQYVSGTKKGIIVTAPLQLNGSGGICKSEKGRTTRCFNSEDINLENKTIPVKHLGLSIAADSKHSQFTVCSPNVAHECNENSYLNSACFKITANLQAISFFTPGYQECTKKTVDLIFLFDGSGSMTEEEFTKNKDFIVDIMNSLKNSSIKFAAAQFSSNYRKVFDFNDYQAGTALDKLMKEPHMKSLTNTHRALEFVLNDILENPESGASRDATKVLVLITDGDPSDVDRNKIIKRYDDKSIIRFVIGVKDAKLDKFEVIASQPTEKYAFKIENYNGLKGILENFQKRIFKMEGSSVARAGDIAGEMSQSGFSAVFYKDILILGSVGSNSWRGSLQEVKQDIVGKGSYSRQSNIRSIRNGDLPAYTRLNESQILDPSMQNDSYMGYSVSVGQRNNAPLYFSGAPRFDHVGRVVLFKHEGEDWTAAQALDGDQIGSYFGAELCSVDIDSDGNTDFLLVGAPLFYQPQERREGQIYVYALTDEMQLRNELNVTVSSMGRFGTTISSLADLNGDGLRDVAVGAPLEDDNRGAVYIYLGDRHKGIRSTFSQRIMGEKIKPGLRFFGQAIDGVNDLGEDGLPDITIGSQGMAVVLRSRPVFHVTTHLSFLPKEISTEKFDCVAKTDTSLFMVTIKSCFEMVETTKSKAGATNSGLNISYTLNVDPMRQTYRGFFETVEKTRNFTNISLLTDKETCFDSPIYMPKCVTDTLSPLIIKLNFSQVDSETGNAILNVDSKMQDVVEVPFEKQCAKNDTCIAELEVDFNFTTPVLLVSEDNYFNVTVKLSNHGDDSYNTSLTVYYPEGLSFSRMILIEATRPTLHSCLDLEGVLDKTICGVSLPVYRSRSAATFKMSFYVMTGYEWNETVSMTITGQSDNTNSTKNNSLTKSIPVQIEIKMAITVREGTTTYLNFTTEDDAPKRMETIYKISNPGLKAFPVTVSLFFPTKLEYNFELNDYHISFQENKTQCSITDMTSDYCSPEKHCKMIMCDTFILDKESTTEFTLSGEVQFRNFKVYAENIFLLKKYVGDSGEVKFKSFVHVRYDKQRYVLESRKQENKDGVTREKSDESGLWRSNDPTMKLAEVRVEFIIPPNRQLIIFTGVGVGLFLLLIITLIMFKLGCFKRKRFPMCLEDEDQDLMVQTPTEPTPAPTNGLISQSETEGKSDPPSEAKLLPDDDHQESDSNSIQGLE